MGTIKITADESLPRIDYREILPLQNESFKKLDDVNFKKLDKTINDHGFFVPLFVWNYKGKFYSLDGHQRLRYLKRVEPENVEYPYVLIHAKNHKDAAKKLLAIDSKYGKRTPEGEKDFIETFEIEEEYIEEVVTMDFTSFDGDDDDDNDDNNDSNNGNNEYSTKVKAPIYEPNGDDVELNQLFDNNKYNDLISEIEKSNIDEDVKGFLKIAASRHIVFNYENIANFYANQKKEVQELMENSALVIIDFNKAIEQGYASLSEEIAKEYSIEYD